VYATADGGALVALKADRGQRRWQRQTDTLAGGKPVVDQGIVYAGSENTIYAFNITLPLATIKTAARTDFTSIDGFSFQKR